jgi:hypothetical protein
MAEYLPQKLFNGGYRIKTINESKFPDSARNFCRCGETLKKVSHAAVADK